MVDSIIPDQRMGGAHQPLAALVHDTKERLELQTKIDCFSLVHNAAHAAVKQAQRAGLMHSFPSCIDSTLGDYIDTLFNALAFLKTESHLTLIGKSIGPQQLSEKLDFTGLLTANMNPLTHSLFRENYFHKQRLPYKFSHYRTNNFKKHKSSCCNTASGKRPKYTWVKKGRGING